MGKILQAGRSTVGTHNQATFYRNLKVLAAEDWIRSIPHPVLGTVYERAGKDHHHHLQCRPCDCLYEVEGCALNEKRSSPPGFVT